MSKVCKTCLLTLDLSLFRERASRGGKIHVAHCLTCEVATRKTSRTKLTAADVRALFDYDPTTGVLTWKPRDNDPRFKLAGQRAGTSREDGRRVVCYKNGRHLCSRIAYAWMTGEWPPSLIDHADNDPTNDSWANLRPANKMQNGYNKKKKPGSSSQHKGVCFAHHAGKWRAEIVAAGQRQHLGYFITESQAAAAYAEAAQRLHGEFARLK